MFIFSIFYYLSTISITIRKDVSILLFRTALIVIITSIVIINIYINGDVIYCENNGVHEDWDFEH